MTFKKLAVLPIALAFIGFGVNSADAQVVTPMPRVAVQLATTGLTNPLVVGQNATLARLVLDTTGSNTAVRIASLPLQLNTGNGALSTSLTNCRVYNEASNVALSSGTNVPGSLVSGMNSLSLDTPITLPANTTTTLAVRCDIASNLVTGGTYQFSLNTANVVATDPTSGVPAVVTLLGAATVPTVPVVIPTVPVVVPGLPNTGNGGNAAVNYAVILGSLAVAAAGLTYARKFAR